MSSYGAAGTNLRSDEEREALIIDHMPLLRHIVGRMCFDMPGAVDREDLTGFGMLGLIGAADSWDSSRGLAFSTYAYPRIRGAILDELRRMDFLPRGRRERLRELTGVVEAWTQAHGQRPSPEEIAGELGWTASEVDEAMASAAAVVRTSLDSSTDDDGIGSTFAAMLEDPRCDDPQGTAEFEDTKERLTDSIAQLPEAEKTVITLYYAEELLLREIADILGVTESRVSQIHSRAIYRLNRALTGADARTGSNPNGGR